MGGEQREPGIDCRHGDHQCAEHFTELSSTALATAAFEPRAAVEVVNHLIGHGWGTAALLTWTVLFGRFAVPDGHDRGQATHRRLGEDGELIPPELASQPWARLLDTLARAAVAGDGQNAYAAIAASADLPASQRGSFALSLLTSTARIVGKRGPSPRLVSVMMLYGARLDHPDKMEVVDDLADATMGFYQEDKQAVERAARAIGRYKPAKAAAAMALAGGLLAELVNDGTPLWSGGDLLSAPDSVVDWADESADAGRGPNELGMCWAMRVAAAYARGDVDQVMAWVTQADDLRRFLFMVTYCAVELVAQGLLTADLHLLAEHGASPPPGHPG